MFKINNILFTEYLKFNFIPFLLILQILWIFFKKIEILFSIEFFFVVNIMCNLIL